MSTRPAPHVSLRLLFGLGLATVVLGFLLRRRAEVLEARGSVGAALEGFERAIGLLEPLADQRRVVADTEIEAARQGRDRILAAGGRDGKRQSLPIKEN